MKSKMARKLSHSQNFLVDSKLVENLVRSTSINSNDLVVEIGPGTGIITSILSDVSRRVIAVEYDKSLKEGLVSNFKDTENVEVVLEDFLRWRLPEEPFKIFSNIPFNLTADIVNKLTFLENKMEDGFLIMQKEAARRFIAKAEQKNTQVSIQIAPFFLVEVLASLDRKYFLPKPNVDSVLVRFKKKNHPNIDVSSRQLYRDFVVYGFNQWKPTALESFKKIFTNEQLKIMSRKYNLARLKPSELSPQQWFGMFDTLLKHSADGGKNEIMGFEGKFRKSQGGIEKVHRTRKKDGR